MSYLVVRSAQDATPESYQLTDVTNGPKLAISDSYIPLTTNSGGGNYNLKVADGTSQTSTMSQSASATFLTSAENSEGLSNVTALTRSSTSATLTRISTSSTEYLTSAGTNTMYSQQHSETTYYNPAYTTSFYIITGQATSTKISKTALQSTVYLATGTFSITRYETTVSGGPGGVSTGTKVSTWTGAAASFGTFTSNPFGMTTQMYSSIPIATTGTNYLTRSSISSYGTCESTSGYSGISSSSSSESTTAGNQTYRAMYLTSSSYSQSASATFLTSAVDSAGLSNTTALTSQDKYLTSAINSAGLSSTTALGKNVYVGYIADTSAWTNPFQQTSVVNVKFSMKGWYTSSTSTNVSAVLQVWCKRTHPAQSTVSVTVCVCTGNDLTPMMQKYYQFTTSNSSYMSYGSTTNWKVYSNDSNSRSLYATGSYKVGNATYNLYNWIQRGSTVTNGQSPINMLTGCKSTTLSAQNQTTVTEAYANGTNIYDVYDTFAQVSTTAYTGYSSSVKTTGYSGVSSSTRSESASNTSWI